jgi:hypothetical protein
MVEQGPPHGGENVEVVTVLAECRKNIAGDALRLKLKLFVVQALTVVHVTLLPHNIM